MKKYEELYADLIAPISNYMAIKLNPRKYHDVHHGVEESDILDSVIEKIKSNIKYASPSLLSVYERYFGYSYYDDGWGSRKEVDQHALVYFLLDDIIRDSRWIGIFRKVDRKRLEKLKYHYGLAACALNLFEDAQAEIIIRMENFSGVKRKIKLRSFSKMLLELNSSKMVIRLIGHLNYVNDSEREMYEEYYDVLNNWIKYKM
jgi:hypothetical protein